jgi:signal transduction histidine kinase
MFRKMRLHRLKLLMLSSYSLLLACSCLWLHAQYRNEQMQLGRDLARLFSNVQEQISDSLMMVHVVTPALKGQESPLPLHASSAALAKADITRSREMKRLVQRIAGLSEKRQQALMRMDTFTFNRLFMSRMQANGWPFRARWIASRDSNGQESNSYVFINSDFFQNRHGVVIEQISGFLLKRTLPQFLFIIVMLAVTGIAFRALYRSLKDQIQLGRLKDDFVSNMSHELKTPVTTVKLALEAMNDEEVMNNRELCRRYLDMASREADRLELLMTRTLNTSMMETGKLFIQPEQHNLELLVQDVLQAYRPKLEQHGASAALVLKGSYFIASVDRLHTQGVLLNLLDNSLKYAGPSVHIEVTLEELDKGISISVADNGPGIPEEYRSRVFEKFFRVPAEGRQIKGYGLGLSYAAQVMAQHKGIIRLTAAPGGGCAFTLTF